MPDFDNTPAQPVAMAFEPWADVRAVLTGEVDPTSVADEDEIDDVALGVGDRFLYAGPGAAAGPYVVGESASTRAPDADAAIEFFADRKVRTTEGTANAGLWVLTTTGAITLGTTSLTFVRPTTGAASLAAAAPFDNNPPGTLTL
jgi:hypothetical protein